MAIIQIAWITAASKEIEIMFTYLADKSNF